MIRAQTSPCLIPFSLSENEIDCTVSINFEKVQRKGFSPAIQCTIASLSGNFSAFEHHLSQAISPLVFVFILTDTI